MDVRDVAETFGSSDLVCCEVRGCVYWLDCA